MNSLSLSSVSLETDKHHQRLRAGAERLEHIKGDLSIDSEIGVILPTYCEAANIKRLVDEIESLGLSISILVIDDSSNDGTPEIVKGLQERYENVLLFTRPRKMGLGTAITDGFRIFLSVKRPPEYIITMDADYSHSPQYIQRLVSSLKSGCDLIIGSRYCRGGSTVDWGVIRLSISKIANFLASLLIGEKIRDFTSGMRCYSSELVQNIIGDLHSETYEIQIETIRQAHLRRFKIGEVPISFENRKKGKSKLSFNEIAQFISYMFFKAILEYRR